MLVREVQVLLPVVIRHGMATCADVVANRAHRGLV